MSHRTVLVVDDDKEIRETFSDALTYEGYPVATAGNGAEALAYLRANPPPCLVLLDLMMPVLNGLEFLEALQHETAVAPVPIIVVSAAARDQVAQALRYPGVSGRLDKPVHLSSLLQTVERFCA